MKRLGIISILLILYISCAKPGNEQMNESALKNKVIKQVVENEVLQVEDKEEARNIELDLSAAIYDESLSFVMAKGALAVLSQIRKRLNNQELSRIWAKEYYSLLKADNTTPAILRKIEKLRDQLDRAGKTADTYKHYFKCINSDICAESVYDENQFIALNFTLDKEDKGEYIIKRVAKDVKSSACQDEVILNLICEEEDDDECSSYQETFSHKQNSIANHRILIPYFSRPKYDRASDQHLLCSSREEGDGEYLIKVFKKISDANGEDEYIEVKKLEKTMMVNHNLEYWSSNTLNYSEILMGGDLGKMTNSLYKFYALVEEIDPSSRENIKEVIDIIYDHYDNYKSTDNERRILNNHIEKRQRAVNEFSSFVERTCQVGVLPRKKVELAIHYVSNEYLNLMLSDPCGRGLEIYKILGNLTNNPLTKKFKHYYDLYTKSYLVKEDFEEQMEWISLLTEATDEELEFIFSKENIELTKELKGLNKDFYSLLAAVQILEDSKEENEETDKLKEKVNALIEVRTKEDGSSKRRKYIINNKKLYLYEFSKEDRQSFRQKIDQIFKEYARYYNFNDKQSSCTQMIIERLTQTVYPRFFVIESMRKHFNILKETYNIAIKEAYTPEILDGIIETLNKYQDDLDTNNKSVEEIENDITLIREDIIKVAHFFFPEVFDENIKALQYKNEIEEKDFLKYAKELLHTKLQQDNILKSDSFLHKETNW